MLTRYDILLIAGLLVVALVGLGIIRYGTGAVQEASIQVDGEEVIRLPLSKDKQFSVEGHLGKTYMEIKDGQIRVTDSPCGRKTCVHTGWIHRAYQTIICMPNHVVIGLVGSSDGDRLDGITG